MIAPLTYTTTGTEGNFILLPMLAFRQLLKVTAGGFVMSIREPSYGTESVVMPVLKFDAVKTSTGGSVPLEDGQYFIRASQVITGINTGNTTIEVGLTVVAGTTYVITVDRFGGVVTYTAGVIDDAYDVIAGICALIDAIPGMSTTIDGNKAVIETFGIAAHRLREIFVCSISQGEGDGSTLWQAGYKVWRRGPSTTPPFPGPITNKYIYGLQEQTTGPITLSDPPSEIPFEDMTEYTDLNAALIRPGYTGPGVSDLGGQSWDAEITGVPVETEDITDNDVVYDEDTGRLIFNYSLPANLIIKVLYKDKE